MHEGTVVVPFEDSGGAVAEGSEDLLIPCLEQLGAWSLQSDSPGSNPDSITYEIYDLDQLLLCDFPKKCQYYDTDLMSELKSGNIYKVLRVVLGTWGNIIYKCFKQIK